jgi:GGDEF domain-containing protein
MHGSDINSLLKSADEAMYEVKRRSKNGFTARRHEGVLNVRIF